ncbi:serine hydrolase domain-containing protein [Sphingomicrobium aestuariivivum]|uniref:serine hydrolase domain-containing protein n=1 Tax=Sphingomicrobium aestuariivivum TaxID=1582356 RepID=UPI001FD6D675|nr:serine hydrolase domain-containing protein [Sphingomicrobium aestuariivivum]MCJ8190110.1 beta-lactamase family protein [Sphingomicrobium aestuariivivum]
MISMILTAAVAATVGGAPAVAAPADEFDSFLAEFRKEKRIPALSVLVLEDGEPVFEKAYGVGDDEGDHPATPDNSFFIASVTKPIAAAAIIAEVEADGTSLDVPMSADAGWQGFCERMKTSPIPYMGGNETLAPVACDRDLNLRDVLTMRVNGDGSRSIYNPMAYARIDRMIEGAGGRPLRTIMRERVLEPAGMDATALGWRDEEGAVALARLVPPFKSTEQGPEKAALPDDDLRAAAGIYASTREIAKFDRAIPQLLSDDYRYLLFEQPVGETGDYRYGWWVQDYEGERLTWHGGWEPDKYSALYLKRPEKGLTLIVLANTEAIFWGNPLDHAKVETSPIAAKWLELFGE